MLDFIYDSLDTVKSLKHPDKKMYLTLTAAIFGVVIVTGLYFVLADYVFSEDVLAASLVVFPADIDAVPTR